MTMDKSKLGTMGTASEGDLDSEIEREIDEVVGKAEKEQGVADLCARLDDPVGGPA